MIVCAQDEMFKRAGSMYTIFAYANEAQLHCVCPSKQVKFWFLKLRFCEPGLGICQQGSSDRSLEYPTCWAMIKSHRLALLWKRSTLTVNGFARFKGKHGFAQRTSTLLRMTFNDACDCSGTDRLLNKLIQPVLLQEGAAEFKLKLYACHLSLWTQEY